MINRGLPSSFMENPLDFTFPLSVLVVEDSQLCAVAQLKLV